MKKKIFGTLIALIMCAQTYASITVAPTKVEINANKLRSNYVTTAVEIRGDKNKPMRFRAYPGYFKISDASKLVVVDKNGEPQDISGKVRFVPSEFTVPPGKTQKLRINIAGINTLPDGESRAILYVEDVEPKEYNVPNDVGIGAQLILKTRVGIPIYVDKGKFVKKAEIEYFNVQKSKKGYYTEMKINSVGNSRIRYNGIIQIVQGRKLIDEYQLEGNIVGVGNSHIARQAIKTDNIKTAGDYTVRLIFYYLDENDSRKNIKKDAILNITGEI